MLMVKIVTKVTADEAGQTRRLVAEVGRGLAVPKPPPHPSPPHVLRWGVNHARVWWALEVMVVVLWL